ncbi:hypothetical protein BZA05DRAFT_391258 [Tricharina praecox]|uniref:uncharacterized protein n=1 Tax=Tricharina praecox TaxID=43433 RepID=UPI00221F41F3|nr:uncharacterized protein BZA05DRAFT_391258 [Tricharina praecox]KAI5855326.1 hypothetical protein BZA05DRAFT_391258 [Tricharina praecox]
MLCTFLLTALGLGGGVTCNDWVPEASGDVSELGAEAVLTFFLHSRKDADAGESGGGGGKTSSLLLSCVWMCGIE